MQDLLKKIEAAAEVRLSFSPSITPAEKLARYKTFLKVESHRLKLLHRAGSNDGLEICQARAAILDALLRHLWDTAKQSLSAQAQKEFPSIALVAIGGFGREEVLSIGNRKHGLRRAAATPPRRTTRGLERPARTGPPRQMLPGDTKQ